MRVLFDQGTPVPLRRYLPHHSVTTVFEKGWSTLQNGELLLAAEQEAFEIFVTTDQNLKHQQNLANYRLTIVILTTTSWPLIEKQIYDVITPSTQRNHSAWLR
jgi:predicted nuclease of predicted toxin-antitoxin system